MDETFDISHREITHLVCSTHTDMRWTAAHVDVEDFSILFAYSKMGSVAFSFVVLNSMTIGSFIQRNQLYFAKCHQPRPFHHPPGLDFAW